MIAGGVAKTVVDRLEAVEVDEQDGHRSPTVARPIEGRLGAPGKEGSIGQVGQGVVRCLVGELAFERLALFDVVPQIVGELDSAQ